MDWSSASEAERTCECGDGDQWPNERKPIFFMAKATTSKLRTSRQPPNGVLLRL
jgi:hypothetical protein